MSYFVWLVLMFTTSKGYHPNYFPAPPNYLPAPYVQVGTPHTPVVEMMQVAGPGVVSTRCVSTVVGKMIQVVCP